MIPRRLGRLARDERGFVLVFVAIALPALIGLVGLTLDGLRLTTLDTELANRVDAAALAAASRLDRSPGALAEARRAALAAANGSGSTPIRLGFRFAASLPDLDQAPNFSVPEASSSEAAIVEVRTSEASLTASFMGLLGAAPAHLQRRATAESQYYACDVTPLALCQSDANAFARTARPGRQYLLRSDGGLVPGSIAVLEPPDAASERQAVVTLASDRPAFCYADRLRRRANIGFDDFDEALNIRFDRYVGRNGPIRADIAAFPPAPVVVSGRHFNNCQSPPGAYDTNPPFAIPRDTVFQGLRPNAPWDAGTGDWRTAPALGGSGAAVATALDEYILWNHSDKGVGQSDRLRNARTRWDLYLAELGLTRESEGRAVNTRSLGAAIATIPSGGPVTPSFGARRENPIPICYGGARPSDQARRRILYMTVTDCARLGPASRADGLSRLVGKFFLTEASDMGSILVEFVGFLTPVADDGKFRHVVQLVRTE